MGRPPLGSRAMTATERSARRREREQAMRAALELIVEAQSIAEARRLAVTALWSYVDLGTEPSFPRVSESG